MGSDLIPTLHEKQKGRRNGRPFQFRNWSDQLPVAETTSTETPGPMVELIDTFFM
jgi:hypothetical protein